MERLHTLADALGVTTPQLVSIDEETLAVLGWQQRSGDRPEHLLAVALDGQAYRILASASRGGP